MQDENGAREPGWPGAPEPQELPQPQPQPGAAPPQPGAEVRGGAPGWPTPGARPGPPGRPSPPPGVPRPETGEARVDVALSLLDDLTELPVTEHPAVFEQVHAQLSEILTELRTGPAGGLAGRDGS